MKNTNLAKQGKASLDKIWQTHLGGFYRYQVTDSEGEVVLLTKDDSAESKAYAEKKYQRNS